jgi:hypothetical protein
MRGGLRVAGAPGIEAARTRAHSQLAQLPERLRDLARAEPAYRVEVTAALKSLAEEVDRRQRESGAG